MVCNIVTGFLKNPINIFDFLVSRGFFNLLPDKTYLELAYRLKMGKSLNLSSPTTFNEKIQWLKLHDRKEFYGNLVDKYEVKGYIAQNIGTEYVIPSLGLWNSFDEIDFQGLPERFVLKCTHDSGGIWVCRDKIAFDITEARKKINRCLKKNYYYLGREWPYKNIRPRIIAEKYMEDTNSSELSDFKIFCFNGKPEIILVCTERFGKEGLKEDFFDKEWNHLGFSRPMHPNSKKVIERPKNLNLMIELAQKISQDFTFIRVDFYEINGKVYFGELTFYPASGYEGFNPEKWDHKLGAMLNL